MSYCKMGGRTYRSDLTERVGKGGGQGGRTLVAALVLLARGDVEFGHAVVLIRGSFSRGIALALVCLNMEEDRLGRGRVTQIFQNRNQIVQIVTVHGAVFGWVGGGLV